MSLKIRPYHPSDLSMLYRICLKTGNSGSDASELYTDPDLVGQFFAAPYAVLEPDMCFVVVNDGKPCGYILGTRDSAKFYQRCEAKWFPPLRVRYHLPPENEESFDARIIRLIHQGQRVNPDCTRYPAHLHIDLLPEAQGQGMGRRLIQTFTDRLRELNVPAVHLGVGKANTGAVKFYERVGFHRIKEYEKAIMFGMHLIEN